MVVLLVPKVFYWFYQCLIQPYKTINIIKYLVVLLNTNCCASDCRSVFICGFMCYRISIAVELVYILLTIDASLIQIEYDSKSGQTKIVRNQRCPWRAQIQKLLTRFRRDLEHPTVAQGNARYVISVDDWEMVNLLGFRQHLGLCRFWSGNRQVREGKRLPKQLNIVP